MGQTYRKLKEIQKSLDAYLKGIPICEKLANANLHDEMYIEGIFKNLNGLAMCYFYEIKNYNDAQRIFPQALPYGMKMFEKRGELYISELADLYHNICATYLFQEKYSESINYSEKALQLYNQMGTELSDTIAMQKVDTLLYSMIGSFEQKIKIERISEYYNEALDLCAKYPGNYAHFHDAGFTVLLLIL